MSRWLSFEAKPFDGPLKAVSYGFACDIYEHSWRIMSGRDHVAEGQKTLFTHSELR